MLETDRLVTLAKLEVKACKLLGLFDATNCTVGSQFCYARFDPASGTGIYSPYSHSLISRNSSSSSLGCFTSIKFLSERGMQGEHMNRILSQACFNIFTSVKR